MAFRVSFFWQQQSSKLGGWSENFWTQLTSISDIKASADRLRVVMDNCKGAQVYCPTFRISDAATFRNVTNVVVSGAAPIPTTTANDADYPSTALQLKVKGASNYATTQWFRGLPDSIISSSGQYVPTSRFINNLAAFVAEYKDVNNQWSVRVLDRNVLKKVVTALAIATGILTVPAHGYGNAGTVVRIRVQGFTLPVQANQIWRATVIDADSLQLNFWTPLSNIPVYGKNPTCRLQTYVYVQSTSLEVVRATSHRTGRPIALLGGRRRRRKT